MSQTPGVRFDEIWFQQDSCPVHNTLVVREYLNNIFPNRVIATHGTVLWAPRSPDLSPQDFFLWGYVKSQIYGFTEDRANTLNELQIKIQEAFATVTPEMLRNMRTGFYNRLGYCLAERGNLFKLLL